MNEQIASAEPVHPLSEAPRRRPWLRIIGCPVIALLVIVAVLGLSWWLRHREVCANQAVAVEANNRGIVLMEQFQTDAAIPEFEEAVRLAPDWLPGRINLGIAQLNASGNDEKWVSPCKTTFEEVLRRDPDNPHTHFCLGMLLKYNEDGKEAMQHFQAVLKVDPNDAYSWYWLGMLKPLQSDEQTECYRQALKRNRHLGGALFELAKNLREKDPKASDALMEEFEGLKQCEWLDSAATTRYGEAGPYAEVIGHARDSCGKPRIGPLPRFQPRSLKVQLAAGARWAKATDLGEDAVAEVLRRVRARFGATLAVLDYNRDGKPDLFLAGAVMEKGRVRDLLLRNDGHGRLRDVTGEMGLAQPRPTLGCVVTDFDNDRWPDLLLTGVGVQKLFRNTGNGKFEDVTGKAELDKLTSVCLGASFIDLDHDGSLDMLICEYAATASQALEALRGEKKPGGLVVFLNSGTAPEVKEEEERPALSCGFRLKQDVPGIKEETRGLTNLAASDLDGDGDLDLVIFTDHGGVTLLRNDRLLRFHRQTLFPDGAWNGALVLDANHDGRSDLFLVEARLDPFLLLNRTVFADEDGSQLFSVQISTDWLPLRQAVAADVDLDSWSDVIALSRKGKPILLHNKGDRFGVEADALGGDWPGDLVAVTVCDLNGDDRPEVLSWSESQGLQLRENQGNGNHALYLELACMRQRDRGRLVRCSANGFGTRVMVQAGSTYVGQELTTRSAGLGQSWQPLLLGMGPSPRADVVRLRWPDGTWQAERAFLAGRRNLIEWKQRKISW